MQKRQKENSPSQGGHTVATGQEVRKSLPPQALPPEVTPAGETPLTPEQENEFTEKNRIVKRALNSWQEASQALYDICHRQLYRAKYRTVEAYFREELGIARSTACQMVAIGMVLQNLSAAADNPKAPLPESQRQARALLGLEPEQQKKVWDTCVQEAPSGKITEKQVRATRVKLGLPTSPAAKPEPPPLQQEEEQPFDIEEAWNRIRAFLLEEKTEWPAAALPELGRRLQEFAAQECRAGEKTLAE